MIRWSVHVLVMVRARTYRRTTEKQRHLTVSDGLLGQIIVDDESVLAVVTEPKKQC